MTPGLNHTRHWQGRRWQASLLALSLGVGLLAVPAQAGKSPKRDPKPFLPPVASINNKLEHAFQAQEAEPFEAITLSAISAPALRAGTRVEKLDSPLTLRPENEFMALVKLRQAQDEADLDKLWQATVERNPVIRFSMEKLMMPADLRNKHSAMFSKVVSTLIQGAALGSQMFLGGGGYQDMGIMATGQALDNIVTGRNKPQQTQLSPTEQIQLAGLIDELKAKLIQTYSSYKSTLQLLSEARETTLKNNNLYSKALATQNELAMMAASNAYYQALLHETGLRQKARLYHVQLERLAGAEAVQELDLAVMVPEVLRKDLPVQSASLETEPPHRAPSLPLPVKIGTPEISRPADVSQPLPATTETVALPMLVEPMTPESSPADAPTEMTPPSQELIGPLPDLAPDILPFSSYAPTEDKLQ